ncbi:ATP-binding protein [Streptomyces mayteni]
MPENLCPPPFPTLPQPCPDNLAYALTLPAAAATPAVAREAAETVLDVHELDDLIEPALLLVHELVACACHFTRPGDTIHLDLRHHESRLRVTVFDAHPRHQSCDQLRHAALPLTRKLTESHRGAWGISATEHPCTGTRTFATLTKVRRRWTPGTPPGGTW